MEFNCPCTVESSCGNLTWPFEWTNTFFQYTCTRVSLLTNSGMLWTVCKKPSRHSSAPNFLCERSWCNFLPEVVFKFFWMLIFSDEAAVSKFRISLEQSDSREMLSVGTSGNVILIGWFQSQLLTRLDIQQTKEKNKGMRSALLIRVFYSSSKKMELCYEHCYLCSFCHFLYLFYMNTSYFLISPSIACIVHCTHYI